MVPPLVLIVDDDPGVRDAFQMLIGFMGYRAEVAEDGEKGYDKFCEDVPDVILLDLKMPGLDGPTLARHIKTKHPHRKTRIIGCTGLIGALDKESASYFDEILHKPVFPSTIQEVLNRYAPM